MLDLDQFTNNQSSRNRCANEAACCKYYKSILIRIAIRQGTDIRYIVIQTMYPIQLILQP